MRHNYLSTISDEANRRRFFLGFGKKSKSELRPGAMTAEEVESKIRSFGVSKKVVVSLLDYAGNTIDETPILITSIMNDHFSGKVVNVDRELLESSGTDVYIQGGGGTVDFYFHDGDIASIEEDIDNEIMESMDNSEILEIIEALDVGDEIIISFYDRNSGGVINGMGAIASKKPEEKQFSVTLNRVNEIDQEEALTRSFDLGKDKIIALQIT